MNATGSAPAFGRFFLPGPTEVRPEVLAAMNRPMVSHRGAEFIEFVKSLQPGLGDVFRTSRPVIIATNSATGLMEAAIRNGSGDRLLCLMNGAFSHRFTRIAAACDVTFDVMEVPFGEVHDPEAVASQLASGDYTGVSLVHSETSTGALQPLEQLAAAIRGAAPEAMIMVDTVSSMGGAPILTDDWDLDFVLTGGQKAMGLPPGLAFAAGSDRLIERSRASAGRGVYFDLALAFDKIVQGLTPTTPAIPVVYALAAQLESMGREGMEGRWQRHAEMAERCHAWVDEAAAESGLALRILAGPGDRSPTVTCIVVPPEINAKDVVRMTADKGWVIGTGYGPMAKETFRIGHMGEHTIAELEDVLGVVSEVLVSLAGQKASDG